jgi:4-hydroxyphenylacetate 3-monooxygenase
MSASSTNGALPHRTSPLSGAEYLASLRDGREVWLHDSRVEDLTTHAAFRNATRMIARLYDALHAPERRAGLTAATAAGGFSHRFFLVPRTVDELVAARDAIAEWARITYGWMGQGPEEGASLIASLGAAPELYGRFEENARRWFCKASEEALFFHHAIVDSRLPEAERDLERDAPLHIAHETAEGLIVNGTMVVPSCAALSHSSFVARDGVLPSRGDVAPLAFILPMSTRGLKLVCRPVSSLTAKLYGSPFDYPLTSRLEEDDAVLMLEDALIPWENVLVHGPDGARALAFQRASFHARTSFQEATRLSVKLEFIAGLLLRSVEAAGTDALPEVRAGLGEVLSYRNLFWGLTEAQARAPSGWAHGALLPNPDHGLSFRIFSTLAYPRIRDVIERTVGSGQVYLSAHASDFMNPETRSYLERFVRGENGYTALDRVKLTKLLWDALGAEIAGRLDRPLQPQTTDDLRLDVLSAAGESGLVDRCKAFAGRCLDEYDLDGWRSKDLFGPTDTAPVVSTRRRTSNW